jgi:uncharacterized damage-inducible protein DinB
VKSRFDGPPASSLERLLSDDRMEFTPHTRVLADLPWSIASARPSGSPYGIAEVLAHMHFWQQRLLAMIADQEPRPVSHSSDGWPGVAEADWSALVESHLAGLEVSRECARDPDLLARPIRAGHENTVGYQLMSHFAHDAHHLGQIILLRRQQGAWPPPGGGDRW